jgi:membrane protease YdiL (CAAX protease family)
MDSPGIPPETDAGYRAVAPAWHTVVVLIVLLGFSLLGAVVGHRSPRASSRVHAIQYVATMIFEWLIVAFIWWGVRRRGVRMADLVGGRWWRWKDVIRDIGIGIGFLIVAGIVLQLIGLLLKASANQTIKNLLPQGRTEMILWVLLSLTAGFCEEVIFRGYFQRQFAALTQSAVGGIALQGIAFGAGHGYQGWRLMVVIAVYGVMFGTLAHWRRSTRPGMITHGLQDSLGGLLGKHLMR